MPRERPKEIAKRPKKTKHVLKETCRRSPVAQCVKDPVFSLQQLGLLLWRSLEACPEPSPCCRCSPKKKKKEKKMERGANSNAPRRDFAPMRLATLLEFALMVFGWGGGRALGPAGGREGQLLQP